MGDRPLGIEANQLAAAIAMDRSRLGQPVRLVASGKRASLVALCAAAISSEGQLTEVVVTDSLGSLKQVIEGKTLTITYRVWVGAKLRALSFKMFTLICMLLCTNN